MSVNFIEHDVDLLPIEAVRYLNLAVEKTPSNDTTVWKALSSGGRVYLIKDHEKIVGSIYLEFYPDILNIVLFGIEDISKYKSYVSAFIKNTMRENKLNHLFIVSRIGWHRIFKELTPVGMIYSYQQGGVCGEA